jgi:NAD-dependent deacetylase
VTEPSLSNAGRLRELLEDARHVVVFTGAGISTESGIPDFRSPGGLWTKFKPIQFEDFLASAEARREYWRRRFATLDPMEQAQPNRGHRAVARLVDQGKVTMVVTQNIDGLHQRSGVSDEQVVELHGNATYARCLDCDQRHEIMPIRTAFLEDGDLPICESCGGIVKSATISFGQAMPQDAMARAEQATLASDLFLSIGSSLVVYPAAAFPVVAKRNGARLVILNRDPTDLDGHADLVLHDEIGPVLGSATGVN